MHCSTVYCSAVQCSVVRVEGQSASVCPPAEDLSSEVCGSLPAQRAARKAGGTWHWELLLAHWLPSRVPLYFTLYSHSCSQAMQKKPGRCAFFKVKVVLPNFSCFPPDCCTVCYVCPLASHLQLWGLTTDTCDWMGCPTGETFVSQMKKSDLFVGSFNLTAPLMAIPKNIWFPLVLLFCTNNQNISYLVRMRVRSPRGHCTESDLFRALNKRPLCTRTR